MKKFIASILSTLMLSSFVSNISLAQEPTTNDVNQIQIEETAREKAIKLCKQEQEKKDKFFENEIKKLENMSDKDYENNLTKKPISRFICSIISFGTFVILPIICLILKYYNGYDSGKQDGFMKGALESCEGINVDTSEAKKFLKSFISKLHPDVFNDCKNSNCFQQIFKQAK